MYLAVALKALIHACIVLLVVGGVKETSGAMLCSKKDNSPLRPGQN